MRGGSERVARGAGRAAGVGLVALPAGVAVLGTFSTWAHFGHLNCWPAALSGRANCVRQVGQATVRGIGESRKKEECRTRHCSRDADQGAQTNSARPAPLSGCGQGCLVWIQEPFGSGWSFPLKQDLTHTSLQVVSWPAFGHGHSRSFSSVVGVLGSAPGRTATITLPRLVVSGEGKHG